MLKLNSMLSTALCTAAALTSLQAFAIDKSAIAEQIASQLQESANLNNDIQNIERSHTPVLVNAFLNSEHKLSADDIGENTEMWLYLPKDRALSDDLSDLVVSYPPAGDEKSWTEAEGYALDGDKVQLDVNHAPDIPVVVIDDHGYYAMKDKVNHLNKMLKKSGLQKDMPLPSVTTAAATGFESSKITKIKFADTKESWLKGAAEMYALVTGVLSKNDPQIVAVEMPYLDYNETTYYPDQIFINWSIYDYAAVDMLFYEHDNDTNYKQIVQALVTAVGAAGSLAGWPPASAIAEITNRVIAAMPDSWYTDQDDFADSCYTMLKGKTYKDKICASQNVKFDMEPFYVDAN
ncbi:hypothetical protein VA7868_02860 [Vibrio aerogenes CECT 7868]|uniref:DUF3103 domain-containing protein n=1 Tax=Vibrio aerogenes CECT 7868 TaxID=1216006 RepID=A0A1M5ZKX0_9VIBR|nr:DUF3103 family protein [Vibrio aerogenes]SHI24824.1 hypothetical protein VA7868_02860 [Vibrio aerogenes CECT 7868]